MTKHPTPEALLQILLDARKALLAQPDSPTRAKALKELVQQIGELVRNHRLTAPNLELEDPSAFDSCTGPSISERNQAMDPKSTRPNVKKIERELTVGGITQLAAAMIRAGLLEPPPNKADRATRKC